MKNLITASSTLTLTETVTTRKEATVAESGVFEIPVMDYLQSVQRETVLIFCDILTSFVPDTDAKLQIASLLRNIDAVCNEVETLYHLKFSKESIIENLQVTTRTFSHDHKDRNNYITVGYNQDSNVLFFALHLTHDYIVDLYRTLNKLNSEIPSNVEEVQAVKNFVQLFLNPITQYFLPK